MILTGKDYDCKIRSDLASEWANFFGNSCFITIITVLVSLPLAFSGKEGGQLKTDKFKDKKYTIYILFNNKVARSCATCIIVVLFFVALFLLWSKQAGNCRSPKVLRDYCKIIVRLLWDDYEITARLLQITLYECELNAILLQNYCVFTARLLWDYCEINLILLLDYFDITVRLLWYYGEIIVRFMWD